MNKDLFVLLNLILRNRITKQNYLASEETTKKKKELTKRIELLIYVI